MDVAITDTLKVMVRATSRGRSPGAFVAGKVPLSRQAEMACLRIHGPVWMLALRQGPQAFDSLLGLAGTRPENAVQEGLRWLLHTAGRRRRAQKSEAFTVTTVWELGEAYAIRPTVTV